MTIWSLLAPVWRDDNCYLGGILVGRVSHLCDTTTATFLLQGEVKRHFKRARGWQEPCEARAWVEAEVMSSIGAAVVE